MTGPYEYGKKNGATAYNSTYVHRRLGRRLGLRGAAARRSATWPLALVGLGARHIRAIRYEKCHYNGQLRRWMVGTRRFRVAASWLEASCPIVLILGSLPARDLHFEMGCKCVPADTVAAAYGVQVGSVSSRCILIPGPSRSVFVVRSRAMKKADALHLSLSINGTSHNSAYVHRRPRGRLGLRGAAARRSATWPLGPVGLGARHIRAERYA